MSSRVPDEQDEGKQLPPNGREALRFPLSLKQACLARHLKQETLAAQLNVKVRTLVSWEAGTRLPSVGRVALLIECLSDSLDLTHDLMLAYIADDLARRVHLQQDGRLRLRAVRLLEQVQAKRDEHKEKQAPHLQSPRRASNEERVTAIPDGINPSMRFRSSLRAFLNLVEHLTVGSNVSAVLTHGLLMESASHWGNGPAS